MKHLPFPTARARMALFVAKWIFGIYVCSPWDVLEWRKFKEDNAKRRKERKLSG